MCGMVAARATRLGNYMARLGCLPGAAALAVVWEQKLHRNLEVGVSRALDDVEHPSFPSYLYPKFERHLVDFS